MRKKLQGIIFLSIFFTLLTILFLVSCGSFEITYGPPPKKPVEKAPPQETAKEPAPPQEEAEEVVPAEKTVEVSVPTEQEAEEPAPSQEIAKTTEEVAPPKKKAQERVIEGVVRIEKNNYLIYDSKSGILYKLVGLQKEEKTSLYQLQGSLISLEIRVISTEAAKAYNAQLIRIIEELISEEKIAEATPSEKKITEEKAPEQKKAEKKVAEEKIAKVTPAEEKTTKKEEASEKKTSKEKPPEQKKAEKKVAEEKIAKVTPAEEKTTEKEKPAEQKKDEEKVTTEETHLEEITIKGIVNIDRNNYYVSDPESGIQYRLVDLKKEDMNRLKKLKGKTVSIEIRVISMESETTHNVQLIRFI